MSYKKLSSLSSTNQENKTFYLPEKNKKMLNIYLYIKSLYLYTYSSIQKCIYMEFMFVLCLNNLDKTLKYLSNKNF